MTTNHHLTDEQLIGDIYRTLNDADRETIDAHLSHCPICRERLSRHQQFQGQVENDIRAGMNTAKPPSSMRFDTIAPNLQRRGFRFSHPILGDALPVTLTLAGLVLAVVGVWKMIPSFSLSQPGLSAGAFPALACFCLMFVSMDQFDRSFSLRPRFLVAAIITGLLWPSTAILGFLNLVAVRDIALILMVNAGRSPAEASFMAILAVFLAAIGFIALVIGGAEYHYKRIGHPSSWKVFIWTLVIQLLVFFTPYFLW